MKNKYLSIFMNWEDWESILNCGKDIKTGLLREFTLETHMVRTVLEHVASFPCRTNRQLINIKYIKILTSVIEIMIVVLY